MSTSECPVVSCKMIWLAMIKESIPQVRLPKWEDVVRLGQRVGKGLLLKCYLLSLHHQTMYKNCKLFCF